MFGRSKQTVFSVWMASKYFLSGNVHTCELDVNPQYVCASREREQPNSGRLLYLIKVSDIRIV